PRSPPFPYTTLFRSSLAPHTPLQSHTAVSGSSTRFACLPQPCRPRLWHWAVTMLTTLLRSLKNQQNLCHQPSLSSHRRPLSVLRLPSRSRILPLRLNLKAS